MPTIIEFHTETSLAAFCVNGGVSASACNGRADNRTYFRIDALDGLESGDSYEAVTISNPRYRRH
jgi:hypothetical protein